ncbi:MAG TPA: hypothetical protein DDX33_00425 [Rikenellaceae bacterium]|nr:hypothetical protein [Rikenellaceae bacterium]
MEDTFFLDNYEKTLQMGLSRICSSAGLIGDELLSSEDIDSKWEEFIKDYVADAVNNFNDYPEAALAWAAFLGMGVAHNWDTNWTFHRHDKYSDYYGTRGWDDMDEHIIHAVLGLPLDGAEAKKITDTLQNCALATLGLIRHEGVEAQTSTGFYVLTRSYTVMFRLGAAIELYRLGYKKVAVN